MYVCKLKGMLLQRRQFWWNKISTKLVHSASVNNLITTKFMISMLNLIPIFTAKWFVPEKNTVHSFLLLSSIRLYAVEVYYMDVPQFVCFFARWWVFRFFPVMIIMNKVAMSIHVYIFVWTHRLSFLLGKYLELLGHMMYI